MVYTYGGANHGSINVAQSLMYSCNYFYYTIGDLLDIEVLDNVAKQLGLGEPTGVELPEAVGSRANPETKKELYSGTDRNWNPGDSLTAAIGQSDHRFTPMQLAVYASTLANDGVRYKATFMNRVVSADYKELLAETTPKVVNKMEMQSATISAYKEGMHMVLNDGRGTAFSHIWRELGLKVVGKTGTAEHAKGSSDHGSFVCFAPMEDPEIAIAIYIEKGGHGATLTSIAYEIVREYFSGSTVSDVITYENKLS
jgi:penicillin-binding protein 2